jgi:hypothetical protein
MFFRAFKSLVDTIIKGTEKSPLNSASFVSNPQEEAFFLALSSCYFLKKALFFESLRFLSFRFFACPERSLTTHLRARFLLVAR